jgi:hypothetical protein
MEVKTHLTVDDPKESERPQELYRPHYGRVVRVSIEMKIIFFTYYITHIRNKAIMICAALFYTSLHDSSLETYIYDCDSFYEDVTKYKINTIFVTTKFYFLLLYSVKLYFSNIYYNLM